MIVMTNGPSVPHRCATPFFLGSVLAAMDAPVHIFLTMEGVELMRKGVAESLSARPGGRKIIEFIRDAKTAGVKLHICNPALPGYEIDVTKDIIEEVDYVDGAGVLADLIINCDKVLTF